MKSETVKIGRHGVLIIPSALRKRFGFEEGDLVITEDHGDGVLIRPAITLPISSYSPEKKAEFLLSSAIDQEDYDKAKEAVLAMGLSPEEIPHYKDKNWK